MKSVKVRVFCPTYNKEELLYYYIQQIGEELQIIPNGCEDSNGSSVCKECQARHLKSAKEELEALQSSDFLFNKP